MRWYEWMMVGCMVVSLPFALYGAFYGGAYMALWLLQMLHSS
jgi:hypothetical protein